MKSFQSDDELRAWLGRYANGPCSVLWCSRIFNCCRHRFGYWVVTDTVSGAWRVM